MRPPRHRSRDLEAIGACSSHFRLHRTGVNSSKLIESPGLLVWGPRLIAQEPQAHSLNACCLWNYLLYDCFFHFLLRWHYKINLFKFIGLVHYWMQWAFKSWVVGRILECNYKKKKIYIRKKMADVFAKRIHRLFLRIFLIVWSEFLLFLCYYCCIHSFSSYRLYILRT